MANKRIFGRDVNIKRSYKLVDEKGKTIRYEDKLLYFRTSFGAIEFKRFLLRKYPWKVYNIVSLLNKQKTLYTKQYKILYDK